MAEYKRTQAGVPYLDYANEGERQVHQENKPIGYSGRQVNTDVLTQLGQERQQFNDKGGFTELEQLGFDSVATTPEAKQKWLDMVYENPETTKQALANFGKLESDKIQALNNDEIQLPVKLREDGTPMNFIMQDLQDPLGVVYKLTGSNPTRADMQKYADAMAQNFGQKVEIQEINGRYMPFVTDVYGNKRLIEPNISATIAAYLPDMEMAGALDLAVGVGVTYLSRGKAGGGLVAKGLTKLPASVKIAMVSGLTSLTATGLDAYTDGFFTKTLTSAQTLFGEADARKAATEQIVSTIGYPYGTQQAIEDGILGAAIPVGFSALVKAEKMTKNLYSNYTKGKEAVKDLYGKTKHSDVYGAKSWFKQAAKDITSKPSTKEQEILVPLAKEVYDAQLFAKNVGENFSIANARKGLELRGINTEHLSDTEVLYQLIATDKMASNIYLNHIVGNHSVKQIDALRQAGQANKFAFKAALDHLKSNINVNTNLSDFVTNFKEVPKQIDKLVEQQVKNYQFGKIDLDREMLDLTKFVYNTPRGSHSIFEGSIDFTRRNQLGSDLRRSIDLASKADKADLLSGQINIGDAMQLIVELENKADAVIKKSSGKIDQDKINNLSIKLQSAIIDSMASQNTQLERQVISEEVFDVINNLRDAMNFKNDYKSLHTYFKDHGKKLSEFLVGNNRDTNLRLITEDLLKNSGELPDLETLSRMFSKNPFGESSVSTAELETFMIKNILDKGLDKNAEDMWSAAEKQLDWLAANKKFFKTQEGKLVANTAEQLLQGIDVASIQAELKQGKPVKFASTDARLSTSTLKASAVIANDKRMKLLGKFLGGAVKTDAYMVDYMSTKLAKAIVNPLDISSAKSVATYLDLAAQRGMPVEKAHQLAEEFGELLKFVSQEQKLKTKVLENGEAAVQEQFGAKDLTPEQFNEYINSLNSETIETYIHNM